MANDKTTSPPSWGGDDPLSETVLLHGFCRLLAVFQPAIDEANARLLRQTWEEALLNERWLTAGVFAKAVSWTLTHVDGNRLPTPAAFLATARAIKAQVERQAEWAQADLHRPALGASPPLHEVPTEAETADDPYACTPEERKRWAWEDAWIKNWAATLKAPPAYAPAWEWDAYRRNQSVANWPSLTPLQRRMKERRIDVEREHARAYVQERLARAKGGLALALRATVTELHLDDGRRVDRRTGDILEEHD